MAVKDHGLEVLKKSGEQVIPGDGGDYYIKTAIISAIAPPPTSDAGTVDYPSDTQEVYKFRIGGTSGTVTKTVTINYTDISKKFIQDWSAA